MSRVVVLGSSGYDLTIHLDQLPRPGETRLGGGLHSGPGGKGSNAAIAARRAGGEVVFLTAFGDDNFGQLALDNALKEGLDLAHAKTVAGVANQVALIFVDSDGRNLIGVAPGASAQLLPADVEALPDHVFEPGGIFLACLEIPLETVFAGLQRARNAGMLTILNPAPAHPGLMTSGILDLVSILTPNQEEAFALTGLAADSAHEASQAARLLPGPEAVLITLGSAGVLVSNATISRVVPAPQVDVIDTVGAGDAFNGALAVALAEGRSVVEAAAFACAAGSLAVTRPGAQGALPNRREIEALLERDSGRVR